MLSNFLSLAQKLMSKWDVLFLNVKKVCWFYLYTSFNFRRSFCIKLSPSRRKSVKILSAWSKAMCINILVSYLKGVNNSKNKVWQRYGTNGCLTNLLPQVWTSSWLFMAKKSLVFSVSSVLLHFFTLIVIFIHHIDCIGADCFSSAPNVWLRAWSEKKASHF